MRQDPLFLDDLHVGDTFITESHKVTAEDIKQFAATFDPQPFHLDEAEAAQTIFSGLAASGWHTAAVTMRLLVTSGPRLAGGIVGAGGEIEWKTPTRPGDVLHVESEVIDLIASKSKPGRGLLVLRARTITQRGDVVQTLTAKLVLPRRPT